VLGCIPRLGKKYKHHSGRFVYLENHVKEDVQTDVLAFRILLSVIIDPTWGGAMWCCSVSGLVLDASNDDRGERGSARLRERT